MPRPWKLTPEGWTSGMLMLTAALRSSVRAVEVGVPHIKERLARVESLIEDLDWELRHWYEIVHFDPSRPRPEENAK